jgi:molybdopterin-containing oxidoreductase family iron-sulfur binding subunit
MITLTPMSTRGEELTRMREDLRRALKKPVAERRWAMAINTKRCTACYACVVACMAENGSPPGVAYRRVAEVESGEYPQVARTFMPANCMQCDNPPCAKAAPPGAITKRPDGIVALDYEKLKGRDVFERVSKACPYNMFSFDDGRFHTKETPALQAYEKAPTYEYGKAVVRTNGAPPVGTARKCHFCLQRLNAGMLPACVTTCDSGAMFFGDLGDPESLVSKVLRRHGSMRLLAAARTEPRVHYLVDDSQAADNLKACLACHR